jgi:hypothetical protein
MRGKNTIALNRAVDISKTPPTLLCRLAFWGNNMTTFERDKAGKLKRLRVLRIMNAIGMIAWREDRYGCAQQRLRMLHPLSWPWAIGVILVALVMHGAVEVVRELKTLWRDECVWW